MTVGNISTLALCGLITAYEYCEHCVATWTEQGVAHSSGMCMSFCRVASPLSCSFFLFCPQFRFSPRSPPNPPSPSPPSSRLVTSRSERLVWSGPRPGSSQAWSLWKRGGLSTVSRAPWGTYIVGLNKTCEKHVMKGPRTECGERRTENAAGKWQKKEQHSQQRAKRIDEGVH